MADFFKNFLKKELELDGKVYELFVRQNIHQHIYAPRLVVVSYLPDPKTIDLLKICIESIMKYTDYPYELWVVDNNSPLKNIRWLLGYENINIALNRTNPKESGSYANAIGLEAAVRLIDPKTKYLMTLHQDTAVCKKGWLGYMVSKFDDTVKAVGVRKDTIRVKDGILHVLGYIIDFQLFKKLQVSFYPELPDYDVGDKAIVTLKEAGYTIFSTPNTLWDKTLIEKIPDKSPLKKLHVDRSFDDDSDIFFLHLGRGTNKSIKDMEVKTESEKSIKVWHDIITTHYLNKKIGFGIHDELEKIRHKLQSDISYSLRRYFIDTFFLQNCNILKENSKIIDIGGKKINKRGYFNIENYKFDVKYANISEETEPDYLCDSSTIPVEENSFDGVILSEVIEHVLEPKLVFQETYRILRPGGKALICTPFLFHIHPDPYDFGRYTDYYYQKVLSDIGFKNIAIEKQGLFFSVLVNMLKLWAYELSKEKKPGSIIIRKLFHTGIFWFQKKALEWEKKDCYKTKRFFSGHTTGYGIICEK